MSEQHPAAYRDVKPPKALAKLDRLREDYRRLHKWALENAEGNDFAQQVAWYAGARLAEWDEPIEKWEQ